jgi:hypothetical protein
MADEPTVKPEGEPMQLEGAPEGGAEPTGAEAPPQPSIEDIDAMVATLDKIGVRSPQHLEGLHHTAQAHGSTANELGTVRAENERLQRELETARQQPRTADYVNPDQYAEGQSVDLRAEVKAAVRDVVGPELRNFYQNEVIGPQQQQSEAYWRDVETAEGSEYFAMVEPEYRAHIANPATQRAMAQGKTSHTNELHKLVGVKFKELAQNLRGAAVLLKEQTPAGTQPPHMETGTPPPPPLPKEAEAKKQALEKLQKEGRGTDDDIDAVIKTLLPDDDPFLT